MTPVTYVKEIWPRVSYEVEVDYIPVQRVKEVVDFDEVERPLYGSMFLQSSLPCTYSNLFSEELYPQDQALPSIAQLESPVDQLGNSPEHMSAERLSDERLSDERLSAERLSA